MFGQSKFDRITEDLQGLHREAHGINDMSRLVDAGHKLRQIKTYIEELDQNWSNRLKTACENNSNVIYGTVFQAERKEIDKTCLKTDEVKKFLGKKLKTFQETRTEIHLKYKARF